jgi:hypothetical protein
MLPWASLISTVAQNPRHVTLRNPFLLIFFAIPVLKGKRFFPSNRTSLTDFGPGVPLTVKPLFPSKIGLQDPCQAVSPRPHTLLDRLLNRDKMLARRPTWLGTALPAQGPTGLSACNKSGQSQRQYWAQVVLHPKQLTRILIAKHYLTKAYVNSSWRLAVTAF